MPELGVHTPYAFSTQVIEEYSRGRTFGSRSEAIDCGMNHSFHVVSTSDEPISRKLDQKMAPEGNQNNDPAVM
jgi:hypothetical protein